MKISSPTQKTRFLPFPTPKHLLFLLDYDGTLTDFKKNPEKSPLSPRIRNLLRRLRQKHPVILVSGRNTEGLIKVSGLKNFPMVGTHGFEGKNLPKSIRLSPFKLRQTLKKEAFQLWKALQVLRNRYPGIHIERKPYSSTLHYRNLGFSARKVRRLHSDFVFLFNKTVARGLWELQEGKNMLEAMPRGFSKGRAVQKILKKFKGFFPIYAGDDMTDMTVFKILGRTGLRIAVGHRVPRKYYDLKFDSPRQLIAWLKKI
jgi:trehalose-phosphatase